MGWRQLFFNQPTSQTLANFEAGLSPLKSKLGQLGAQIALNREKGMKPSESEERDFKQTAEALFNKFSEYKNLVNAEVEIIQDPKEQGRLTDKLAEIEKWSVKLTQQINLFN
jgi:hypothetical protein